ncbi:Hypothetical protein CINCED_3A009241 [Cinara cedri]|uniref:Uncharacterized protein n=1 Tax=Cinara cedri TaxID=506608 RepID=A0A5E4NKE0_9HEMI|nr:Hypothetical protein CINCED_3A009241 [Cinara cedri]
MIFDVVQRRFGCTRNRCETTTAVRRRNIRCTCTGPFGRGLVFAFARLTETAAAAAVYRRRRSACAPGTRDASARSQRLCPFPRNHENATRCDARAVKMIFDVMQRRLWTYQERILWNDDAYRRTSTRTGPRVGPNLVFVFTRKRGQTRFGYQGHMRNASTDASEAPQRRSVYSSPAGCGSRARGLGRYTTTVGCVAEAETENSKNNKTGNAV